MKKIILYLMFLFCPLSALGSSVYIALLKSKKDPYKFVILVGDHHFLHPSIENFQMKVVDDLLAAVKTVPTIKYAGIDLKIECIPSDIPGYITQTPESAEALIEYLRILSAIREIPFSSDSFACDIADLVDTTIYQLTKYLIDIDIAPGEKVSLRSTFRERENLIEQNQYDKLIVNKGPHYFEFMQHPKSVGISTAGGKPFAPTIAQYIQRLNDLEQIIQKYSKSLPLAVQKPLINTFLNSKNEVLDIIKKYHENSSDSIAVLMTDIIKKEPNFKKAALLIEKLENPITFARDIPMIAAVYESQKKNNVTILFAGMNHIEATLKAIKNDFDVIKEVDILTQTTRGNLSHLTEAKLWQEFNDIAQRVPLFKNLIEKFKKP